ncbi:MAG: hypothetical protein ACOYXR_06145 [Nitrospirota bacterium]
MELAEANPGFARRYNVSCAVCHVAFPKLNEFGRDYAGNGYQFPGEDPKGRAVETGDPLLNLPTSPTFAIRADGFFRARNDTAVTTDFESPLTLKLFSTGYLAKDLTYYFYFLASEGGEVVGLEDAFLYFNNLGGHDWDAVVGQFQVMDTFYPREQRLTFQDISIYTANVVNTASGGTDPGFKLAYDRGVLTTWSAGPGFLMVGVTNGNGLGELNNGHFDSNAYKNQMARIAVDIPWMTVGMFGYHGKDEDLLNGQSNRFVRYGPDLYAPLGKRADLRANWIFGHDDHPTFTPGEPAVAHNGGFVEADVHFNDRWTGVLLYNQVSSNDLPTLDSRTLTANVTYYHLRNLKFLAEYTHDLQPRDATHPEKTHTGVLGVVLAY